MSSRLFDWLGAGMVVAAILVLTRPGSQGPSLVSNLGSAVSGVFRSVTGQ